LFPIHKEGNEPRFIYTIKYDCTTFTLRVNVLNENTENTVRTKGIQITLYFIMSSISLVKYMHQLYDHIDKKATYSGTAEKQRNSWFYFKMSCSSFGIWNLWIF